MNIQSRIENTAFSFDNSAWRLFPKKKRDQLGLASNELWANTETKVGALVCPKATKYPEHALSASGLAYLADAVQSGKIPAGIIVLSRWDGTKRAVVAEIPVADMIAAVAGRTPRDGSFGPYFWLNADGTPYDDDGEVPF